MVIDVFKLLIVETAGVLVDSARWYRREIPRTMRDMAAFTRRHPVAVGAWASTLVAMAFVTDYL